MRLIRKSSGIIMNGTRAGCFWMKMASPPTTSTIIIPPRISAIVNIIRYQTRIRGMESAVATTITMIKSVVPEERPPLSGVLNRKSWKTKDQLVAREVIRFIVYEWAKW